MITHLSTDVHASSRDYVICGVLAVMVVLLGAMTFVRLGYAPSSLLQPFLSVESAAAQTWNARVGRMFSCGTNCFACDVGYGFATNHHTANGGNKNDAIWWTCVAGPW